MYKTYYLFVDSKYDIFDIFEKLRKVKTNEMKFTGVKEFGGVLPQAIVIDAIYKDSYMKSNVKNILRQVQYTGHSELLTPLVKEMCIM